MSESDDKKHDPSERKLDDAAAKGRSTKSTDFVGLAVLLAVGTLVLKMDEPLGGIGVWMRSVLQSSDASMDASSARLEVIRAAQVAIAASAPFLFAGAAAATVATLVQTRALAYDAVGIDFDKLDPSKGLERLADGSQMVAEVLKSVVRVLAVGIATGMAVSEHASQIASLAVAPDAVGEVCRELAWTAAKRGIPMLVIIGSADFAWSWWKSWQSMMRTDQEVKDENKEQDGDPRLRAQRRARARQIAMGAAIQNVKEANVVITNPTHVAVALRFDPKRDKAPVVVAKGMDHTAARIRAEADRLGIPRVEQRSLARELHRRVRIGRPIPGDLFGPVARVLAAVWRRKQRRR